MIDLSIIGLLGAIGMIPILWDRMDIIGIWAGLAICWIIIGMQMTDAPIAIIMYGVGCLMIYKCLVLYRIEIKRIHGGNT
jgi:hypothetical protein